MCKHVAAVLYGAGIRLDEDPTLFFTLRDIPLQSLIKKTVEAKMQQMLEKAGSASARVITADKAAALFPSLKR